MVDGEGTDVGAGAGRTGFYEWYRGCEKTVGNWLCG